MHTYAVAEYHINFVQNQYYGLASYNTVSPFDPSLYVAI